MTAGATDADVDADVDRSPAPGLGVDDAAWFDLVAPALPTPASVDAPPQPARATPAARITPTSGQALRRRLTVRTVAPRRDDRSAGGGLSSPATDGVELPFVVEIISPGDRNPLDPRHVRSLPSEYAARGVQEYIGFRTTSGDLRIFDRRSGAWAEVADRRRGTSALTGVHMAANEGGWSLKVEGLDGPFLQPEEIAAQARSTAAQAAADRARSHALAKQLRCPGVDPETI